MYHLLFPLKILRQKQGLSERALAITTGLPRLTLRSLFDPKANFTLKTLLKITRYFNLNIVIMTYKSEEIDSTSVAVSYRILRDGFHSWKIHIMDMVDEFRSTLDMRLLLLPPSKESDKRIKALMSSVVLELCHESMVEPPQWAKKNFFLDNPWFVSEIESLKAFALLESPLSFRKNNIFVLDNFLKRA